jgi:hypothetical protein
LKKEKEKKLNHKLKRFFLNEIRPPKIDLFEEEKKTIIIWNDLKKKKKKHDLFFGDFLTSIEK